jgi:hypothetical protein
LIVNESPKYFALGLKLGLIDSGQVQTWVDEQIRLSESPSEELLNLAYMRTENEKEAYSLLSSMPDDTCDFDALRNLFSNLENFPFENINACANLAKNLYHILCEHDYKCPDDFSSVHHLDDAFFVALNDTRGNSCEVQNEFKEFIGSFKKTANKRMQSDAEKPALMRALAKKAMEPIVRKNLRKGLIYCLHEFSSKELQSYWVTPANNGLVVSFSECMCTYFDDLGLEEGLEKAVTEGWLSKKETEILSIFHSSAELYNPKDDYDHENILNDKAWIEVRNKAAKAWYKFKETLSDKNELELMNKLENELKIKLSS